MLIRLADICDIEKGQQIDTDKLEPSKPYKYINGGIKESGYFDEYNTIGNTITVSEGGASCGYVNYVCEPFWCGCHCYRLTNHNVDSRYLYYALKANEQKIMDLRTGVAMPNIRKSSFENLVIKICESESEQQKVVLTLDKITSLIKKSEHELLLLDSIIKSRFNEMFSAFPKVELSQISQIIMGQSPESTAYNDDGIGLPFFQGKADYGEKYTVVKHYTKKWNKEAKRGYVLMSVRAPVGPVNIASTDCAIGRGLCAMNAKPNKANNEFLYNALNSMQQEIVLSGKDGSTFAAINKDQVYKLLLPQAPIELQNDFSEFVHRVDKLKFSL